LTESIVESVALAWLEAVGGRVANRTYSYPPDREGQATATLLKGATLPSAT
jgi:hypothetical protein